MSNSGWTFMRKNFVKITSQIGYTKLPELSQITYATRNPI